MTPVTLKYDGSKQAAHLQKVYRWQGLTFPHGEELTVSDDVAGHILATTETVKAFEVVSGTPHPWSATSARQGRILDADRVMSETFNRDPAAELANMASLPAAVVSACNATAPKLAIEAINVGTYDDHLQSLALWAQLGGKLEIAKSAARRFEAVRLARR